MKCTICNKQLLPYTEWRLNNLPYCTDCFYSQLVEQMKSTQLMINKQAFIDKWCRRETN